MTPTISLPHDGRILLVGWPDPVADSVGHPVRSDYVETYWLGILGPTATWLLRRCSDKVLTEPDGAEIDLHSTAGSLGLAHRADRPTPFSRGFDRLMMFGLMRHVANHPVPTFAVRTHVPPLSLRHVSRLPAQLQISHSRLLLRSDELVSVRA